MSREAQFVAAAICLAAGIGCAGQQKVDPTNARAAVYASDFQSLFQEVALEVKKEYPNLAARPEEHAVKTAWHQLPLTERVETAEDPLLVGSGNNQGDPNADHTQRRNFRRDATKREMRHFVRFDVTLEPVGSPGSENQWRVVVTGQASEHDGTGIPTELTGAARPYWLDARIARLEVAIYDRIKAKNVAAR